MAYKDPLMRADYARRYREANRHKQRDYNRARQQRNKDALKQLKDSPCVDCGVRYPPCVMDFDHVRGDKLFHVNAATMGRRGFAEELAKCELRCANCHRLRHFNEEPAT